MSIIRPMVRPAVRAATRPSSGLYQSKIVLVDATLRRYMGTFTRNGTATYFDSSGVLQTAAANVPRWGYDPATGALRGLLIEQSDTNELPYSNDFSQWTLDTSSMSITPAAVTGPDGALSMSKLVTAPVSGNQYIQPNASCVSGTEYIFDYFAKDAGDGLYLMIDGAGLGDANEAPVFDLANGTVSVGSTSTVLKKAWMRSVGNGVYRCFADVVASGTVPMEISLANSLTNHGASALEFIGDGTSGNYIFGASQVPASVATSYTPTNGSPVTRAADNLVITDLSGFDRTQGTFVFNGDVEGLIAMDILGNGSLQYLGINAAGNIVATDGSNSVQSSNAVSANTSFKAAVSYSGGSASVCLNGATVAAGTFNASLPSSLDLSGYIYAKAVTYYPYVMTAAQLQAATA